MDPRLRGDDGVWGRGAALAPPVIPANAGTHGGEKRATALHPQPRASMGPGVRRDDERGRDDGTRRDNVKWEERLCGSHHLRGEAFHFFFLGAHLEEEQVEAGGFVFGDAFL